MKKILAVLAVLAAVSCSSSKNPNLKYAGVIVGVQTNTIFRGSMLVGGGITMPVVTIYFREYSGEALKYKDTIRSININPADVPFGSLGGIFIGDEIVVYDNGYENCEDPLFKYKVVNQYYKQTGYKGR